ncbi:hypothetical protein D3OALGA1CA_2950 [Olavius algarvensis associated proteobacterium Delta 3]|nr:hypothetical protein D3OALGB2SA_3269 [Olavius algarvensis associated proteobacterium Delta 3]CAB5126714.1 hypothetical protein D3OALGA1CA_2950 [Olavius algarvensis associated proteobacterium Delta 3]
MGAVKIAWHEMEKAPLPLTPSHQGREGETSPLRGEVWWG